MSIHESGVGTEPFLRWAGGKRWLAPLLSPLINDALQAGGGRYHEPFVGGGAIFFGLAPHRAILSDLNADLVATYRSVRDEPGDLVRLVSEWPVDKDTYSAVRSMEGLSGVAAAARFVYLNRTCYGGMHRTNKAGRFNVPYGGGSRTPLGMISKGLVESASRALKAGVELRHGDFGGAFEHVQPGDVVYCDPPYHTVGRLQFDRYGADVFEWRDQVRLAGLAGEAVSRGATVLVSNGATREIGDLYAGLGFQAFTLRRKKTIGNQANSEGVHDEVILVRDPTGSPRWSALAGHPALDFVSKAA